MYRMFSKAASNFAPVLASATAQALVSVSMRHMWTTRSITTLATQHLSNHQEKPDSKNLTQESHSSNDSSSDTFLNRRK